MLRLGHRLLIIASLLALIFASAPTYGAYLESDYDDRSIIPDNGDRPISVADNHVTALLRRVNVGRPHHFRGLTVFPLTLARGGNADDIASLDEALRNDWITIREKETAQVPEVRVRNDSKHLVLLMGGEIITGGKQNRIIREDVLLPRRSQFVDVPVYCVEQERWAGQVTTFASPATLAHPALRSSAASRESQQAIWKAVDAQSQRTGVSSRTRNYQAVYEDKTVQKRLNEYVGSFRAFPGRSTVGAVAVAGNRIIAADLFSSPALFGKLWQKICRSYGMDAIVLPQPRRRHLDEVVIRVGEREIREYLSRTYRSRFVSERTPGAGRCLRISGAIRGRALVANERLIHAVLFPGNSIVPLGQRGER